MWKAVCLLVWFCGGFLYVAGDISELESLRDKPPIRIGAFNIQILGRTKFSKRDVVEELTKIISRYHIILIQEIRDSTETYIHKLVDEVNNYTRQDEPFSLVVSERLGRTTSKEQYAFLYRPRYVRVTDVYQYNDTRDKFERPPYAVKFHSDELEMHEFGIIGLHSKPEDAFNETNELDEVYKNVEKRFNTTNILIAGDLNADCSYLSRTKMANLSLRQDTTYQWLIHDSQDTTVGSTDCAYDRFITKSSTWLDNIIPGSVQVFLFDEAHNLSEELAISISDHYPIEMELRGKYGNIASAPLPTLSLRMLILAGVFLSRSYR